MKLQLSLDHLDQVIAKKKKLSLFHCFKGGFDIWKIYWAGFLGFFFINMIISGLITQIPYFGKALNVLILTPAFLLGGALVSHRVRSGKDDNFAYFFSGLKYSWNIFLSMIIKYMFYIILISPIIISIGLMNVYVPEDGGLQDISQVDYSSFNRWTLLFFIPLIYLLFAVTYATLLIGFYKLDGFRAIWYSFKLVKNNWLRITFFIILMYLFALLGFAAVGFGIFFTISMIYPILYDSFSELTELESFKAFDMT